MNKKYTTLIYLALIIFLVLLANYPQHTSLSKLSPNDSLFFFYIHEFIRISILEFHQFPLWIPSYFGGMPFFANAQSMLFNISGILSVLLPTEIALNLSFILLLLLAGISMFFLVRELGLENKFAFISSLLYSLSSWPMHHVIGSGLERLSTYAWFPLIFLFSVKLFKNKNKVKYSILVGIFLAVAFHACGLDTFLWFCFFFSFFFLYMSEFTTGLLTSGNSEHAQEPLNRQDATKVMPPVNSPTVLDNLFGKCFKKRFIQLAVISIIIFAVFFGLVAVKLLPLVEFSEHTNKKEGFTLEQSFEKPLTPYNAVKMFFSRKADISYSCFIGIIASILLLLSLFKLRNKYVLFSFLMILLNISIAMSISLYFFLWKFIPGFSAQHDVTRSLFITVFFSSILVGFGASALHKIIGGRLKSSYKNIIFIALIILILLELNIGPNIFQKPAYPLFDFGKHISGNNLLQNLSKEDILFRINNIGTHGIGGAAGAYAIPLKLQILYGYNNVWIPEYFNEYLFISSYSPAKFYGMLNTKYLYSDKEFNLTGTNFVKKFEKCDFCYGDDTDAGVDGPFLYLNKKNLPRAYFSDNVILVVGEKEQAKKIMYSIMIDDSFNPASSTIIIGKEKISEYSPEELNRYKSVILAQNSITDQQDITLLKKYISEGSRVFPDITQSNSIFDFNELVPFFKSLKKNNSDDSLYSKVVPAEVGYYSPNKIKFNVSRTGFLVISEKFFMFGGWRTLPEKMEILRANGINSAVYLDKNIDSIEFSYKPKTFIYGSIITVLTIVFLLLLLLYNLLWKKQNSQ